MLKRTKTCWYWAGVVWITCALAQAVRAEVYLGQVVGIPDGDTLWLKPDGGHAPRKLRLVGLDAPEICQRGGLAARAALVSMVDHQRVSVTVKYSDVYGRGLARVRLHGQDVGAAMVQAGQAWSSRWRRSQGPYAAEELSARAAKRGLFADPAPELPSDFRKRHGSCYAFSASANKR